MARNPEVYTVIASTEFLYHSVSEMPWPKIEAAANVEFTNEQRTEILRCVDAYCYGHSWVKEGVRTKEFEAFRDELTKKCIEIKELSERHPPMWTPHTRDRQSAALSALSLLHDNGNGWLREEYRKLAEAANGVLKCLAQEPTFELSKSGTSPETAGLRDFLRAMLEDAVERDARSKQPYGFSADAKEYSRWGVSIGPRCKGFPEFVSAILGKEVTEGQLRTVWQEATAHRREMADLAARLSDQDR